MIKTQFSVIQLDFEKSQKSPVEDKGFSFAKRMKNKFRLFSDEPKEIKKSFGQATKSGKDEDSIFSIETIDNHESKLTKNNSALALENILNGRSSFDKVKTTKDSKDQQVSPDKTGSWTNGSKDGIAVDDLTHKLQALETAVSRDESSSGENEDSDSDFDVASLGSSVDSESLKSTVEVPEPTVEDADKITSLEPVSDEVQISTGPVHHMGPRRCQSQRESRILNPRVRKFSVPTEMGASKMQYARPRKTSAPLPGESYREMMERHVMEQHDRRRRNTCVQEGNIMSGTRRLSSTQSIEGRHRRISASTNLSKVDQDSADSDCNNFYLNLPLLM